ncbi:hypothetical protein YC2023_016589 [Brassica napus]
MRLIIISTDIGSTVVTNAITSMGLTRFITERGGRHCLYRVGYRNVIDKGVELNRDGIETHLMSHYGDFKTWCSAYIVVKIMIEMVRMRLAGSNECIDSLIKDLKEPLEALGLRMNILSKPRDAIGKGIEAIATFSQYIEEVKLKGWELDSCGECWVIEGCIMDSNDHQSAIDAHMYRVGNSMGGCTVHIRQSIHIPNIALSMQSMLSGGCLFMTRLFRDL